MNPVTLTALIATTLSVATIAAGDWPQWRGPDRNGFVDSGPLIESLPSEGLAPQWKVGPFAGGNSGGWSSPAIAGGRVYLYGHTKTKNPDADGLGPAQYPWLPPEKRTGMTDAQYEQYEVKRRDESERRAKAYSYSERMLCVDLDSGDVVWDRTQPSKYTRFTQSGTPCVAEGRVFILGSQRTAWCYDAATGEVRWSRRLPGDFRDEHFSSSFAVSGNVALVSCGALTALSVQDGEVLWQGEESLDFASHSSPAVWRAGDESVAIVNARGGMTRGYGLLDGRKLWEAGTGAGQSTPIVAGDLLLTYGSSRKSGLSAYQLSAGAVEKSPQLLWQFQRAADSGSTPVVRGDAVFVQGDKRLAKVDLSTGAAVWQTTMRISNPRYTSLVAAGDQVFYGWEGLLCFDAEAGRYEQLYDAEVDFEGRLIGGQDLRAKLKLDQLAGDDGGLARAEQIWQDKAIKSGPLGCSTPAVSDGRIVIRLRNAVICYDLRR
jgi:outer membrane protein assembly factor BamB